MARRNKVGRATSSEEIAIPSTGRSPQAIEGKSPTSADAAPSAQAEAREAGRPGMLAVGIGASAGGLEALAEFFGAVPAESGLAFVVVSQAEPTHEGALGQSLAKMTAMPVLEVEGDTPVEPDHVLVVPPEREMVVSQGILRLVPGRGSRALHSPVDTLLGSLAADFGSRTIGVVLSGTGQDGTRGLKAIKEGGGITFAQDQTARFCGMPQSAVAAGCVDYVLPPSLIVAELLRVARHARQGPSEEALQPATARAEDVLHQILRLLSDTTGVDFVNYNHATLRRRVERRVVMRRLRSLAEYLQCLRDDPVERHKLYDEILIPVTGFFRDPDQFKAIGAAALPRLLRDRPPGMPLRLWVPGCATGEEVYSVAIWLLEHLGGRAADVPVKIFATDISDRALEVARAGAYGESIAAEVSAQRLHRFFVKTDRGYEIRRAVRELCLFARHDVTRDQPFSQLDLICCRNVLTHLGPALQGRVLPTFHHALKPGGILVLGRSEGVGGFTDFFGTIDEAHNVYVRTRGRARLPHDSLPGAPPRARTVARQAGGEGGRGPADLYREADRLVLADYAPPGVLVDENLHVVQFRGDTGDYLKPAPGAPTSDLLLMAREGLLGAVQAALDRAGRENAPVRKRGVRVKAAGRLLEVDLRVIPIADLPSGGNYFVVLFEEVRPPTATEAAATGVPAPPGQDPDAGREIARLNHELGATKGYLQSLNEEKDVVNEELGIANEELVSSNEELVSSNEELEAAKEELVVANEKLTALNEELQEQVRAANRLSDDVVNFIECTNIPIVVLGADLRIRRTTPGADRLLDLRPSDVGRPVGDLKLKVNVPDLESMARAVIDALESGQREVVDAQGCWHHLSIRPYKTRDRKIDGAVLMLIDIDPLKRRERQIQESRDYALGIVETVREPLVVLDGQLRVRTANRAFYRTFRAEPRETEGRLIYELGDRQWDIPALRTLMEEVLPLNSHFEGFEVENDFPGIGRRTMLLNARRVIQPDGEYRGHILLAIEDITASRQAERLRQESQDRLRSLVDTAVDAIITADASGIIHSVNPAAERMFGYAAAEMIGQNVKMLTPSPYREGHDRYLARDLRTGERRIMGLGREVEGRRRDGSTFPLDLSVSEFHDRSERMFSGVLRDLSARKALEQEVLEIATTEQRRIGQELHDDIGQELTALGLLAEGLVEALDRDSPGEAVLATKISDGLKRVLGRLRALSRGLIPVEVDALGLMAALGELASQTGEVQGVRCTFRCEEPVLVEDNQTATHLYSIAKEAVTNALKHGRAKAIAISLEGDESSITLGIRDDGVGFPPEPVDPRGMGLKIMRYRAGLINAGLVIGRQDSGGTLVACTVNRSADHAGGQDRGE